MVCKRVFLSGKVQGVSFRFHSHEIATKLNLQGWVRNLDDGRVEIVIAGNVSAVEQMIEWARKGPPLAEVNHVEVHEAKETLKEPFFIRRDGGK